MKQSNAAKLLKGDDPQIVDYGTEKSGNCFRSFLNWFLTILLWVIIIYIFITKILDKQISFISFNDDIIVIMFFPVYLFNVIYVLSWSPTTKYLLKAPENIKEKLTEIFERNNPSVYFSGESYHNELVNKSFNNYNANKNLEKETIKVITYRREKPYIYKSCLDISGLLLIDLKNNPGKKYLKLKLNSKIFKAKDETIDDFQKAKNDFILELKTKDVENSITENMTIKDIDGEYFFRLVKKKDYCVSFCLFFFFTLIGCGQCYKHSVNKKCLYREFTVQKIFSKNDLTNAEYIQKYIDQIPKIKIITAEESKQLNEINRMNSFGI